MTGSPALSAQCGVPYRYSSEGLPAAEGTGPLTWSLGPDSPGNAGISSETGELDWVPSTAQKGKQRITLRVSNPGGSDAQSFDVEVECEAVRLGVGCGCSSDASGSAWVLLVLATATIAGRARRPRTKRV